MKNILGRLGRSRRQSGAGFTLIEVIIDTFVITIVFGALVSSFILVLKTVDSGRLRTVGAALANEQMESLRNLPYDSLSTQHGTILPQGNIPDTQTVSRSGSDFILTTTIIFVDDPFDGCALPIGSGTYSCTDSSTSNSQDLVPVDYKRINIVVTRPGDPLVLARLSSDAAAKAAETPSNTGMLLVIVNDADGQPLELADVTVTNTGNNVSIQAQTNAQGYVFIANLNPDNQNGYHIVATKNGYSTDLTYTRTPQNPNQFQPDVDINIQQITTQTLVIDQLSTMRVTVKNETGATINNLTVTATSSKISQNNPTTPKNIYTAVTDGSGLATFSNIEWDAYTLTAPNGYYVVLTAPYQPVSVDPGATEDMTFVLTTDPNFPRITDVNPEASTVGSTIVVDITGSNFASGSTVVLRQSGQADVVPTQTVVAANQKKITITLNLTGIATGNWDVVVTVGGNVLIQTSGFAVS